MKIQTWVRGIEEQKAEDEGNSETYSVLQNAGGEGAAATVAAAAEPVVLPLPAAPGLDEQADLDLHKDPPPA